MDPATIIKLITNSTWIVTQLLGDEIVKFEEDKYELEVAENIPLGPILQLRAKVLLQDEPLEFYLKDLESGEKAFQLNPATGELYLVRNLDYEREKSYVLTVGARVGAATAETTVNIAVVDRNEFPPVFTRRTYETQITEEDDRHLPKSILKVSATDQDGGRWGEIRYILSGEGVAAEGTTSSPPSARSGENRPTKPLQTQETEERKRLNYDQSFASAVKEAEPQDLGESFKPSLSNSEGQTLREGEEDEIDEKSKGRAAQGNGEESKDSRSPTVQKPYFWVDNVKGDVLLLRPLDRDPPSGRSQWRLKITATDGEWQTTSDVIINVKDVNDNPPYFPDEPLLTSVPENAKKGTFVTRVTASDNDDQNEARNAKVFYSLDKNVVDESSGQPIFEVDNSTGVIVTNLCCLDREKTPSYSLQIVATDGGGLKGTGTVSIEVTDENDVGPKFSRDNWVLKVTEEEDLASPIGSISIADPDVTNDFAYRITSGDERKQFYVKGKTDGSGVLIYSKTKLDYEDPEQREGFRFRVEVTDLGPDGWSNKKHTSGSWVTLILQNKNDNEPKFESRKISISLAENSPLGASLASFRASDDDFGEESRISYSISGSSNKEKLFRIDQTGVVILSKHLDRETLPHHKLEILAADSGEPRKTATATLQIEITDVNDSPPKLSSAHHFHVAENTVPLVIGRVHLDDPDDWTLGHGPPFTMAMDPRGSRSIFNKVAVSFDPEAKEGHGEGIIRTLVPLDREMDKTLYLPLIVSDGGFPRQSATVTVTITVADVNDNPMSFASKHVVVHTMQPASSNVPLGRIYVKDPDDWDSSEKKYSWSRPHPLFILNTTTGDLFMKPDARPGRYELGFFVSDEKHGQSKVESNVSVQVKALTNVDIKTTNPLVIHMDPFRLVHRTEGRPSYLELILETIQQWLSEAVSSDTELQNSRTSKVDVIAIQKIRDNSKTKSSLWIHTPHYSALQNFLLIQKVEYLENLIGAPIEEVGTTGCLEELQCDGRGCWSKIEIRDNFTLIDANETSIVGPELHLISGCGCQPSDTKLEINGTVFINDDAHLSAEGTLRKQSKESNVTYNYAAVPKTDTLINSEQREHFSKSDAKHVCIYNPCLNGGKCLPTSSIEYRCICPHGTFGKFCKILSRHFDGSSKIFENGNKFSSSIHGSYSESFESAHQGSWSWLSPMPTCSNIHISLEVQTSQENALLLYTGLQIPRNIASPSDKSLRSKVRNIFPLLTSKNLLLNRLNKTPINSIDEGISVSNSDKFRSRNDSVNKDTLENNKYFIEHNNFRTKRSVKIDDSERYQTNLIRKKKYIVSQKYFLRSRNPLLMSPKVSFSKKFKSKYGFRQRAVNFSSNKSYHRQYLKSTEQMSIANGPDKRKKRRKVRSQPESADMLMLEIHNGRPSVHLNLGHGIVHIYLNESHLINDNRWHRIDIIWNKEFLRMFVDLCSHVNSSEDTISPSLGHSAFSVTNETKNNSEILHENLTASRIASSETFSPFRSVSSPSHYSSDISTARGRSCKGSVRLPGKARQLNIRGSPLQLGGVSRSLENSLAYPSFLKESMKGCIKNVRINRELKDLGHSLLSHRSYPGCKDQQSGDNALICGIHGQKCVEDEECVCDLGWTGLTCNQPKIASTFLQQSFATLALSFTPSTFTTKIQFRIRSHGNDGEVIRLSSAEGRDSLSLGLIGGHVCFTLQRIGYLNSTQLCLQEVNTNDGSWHDVTAEKSGASLTLQVDGGDGPSYNSSFLVDELTPFNISRHDGLHIGGNPEYRDGKVASIKNDFNEGCINDLRLNGHSLPLPPVTNATQWAQVTLMKNVREGCTGAPQCTSHSCRPPFACFDSWNSFYCSCGDGKTLSSDRSTCEDINECKWGPCLNGGSCYNTVPGFFCECQDNFEGPECQILVGKRLDFPSSLGLMFCLASFCVLLFLLICVFLLFKKHQSSFNESSPKEIANVSMEEEILPRYIETNLLTNSNSPKVARIPSCLSQNHKIFHSEDRITFVDLEAVIDSGEPSFSCQFTSNVASRKCKTVNFQLTPEEIITLDNLNESPPQIHCSTGEDPSKGKNALYFARSCPEGSLPYSKKFDKN